MTDHGHHGLRPASDVLRQQRRDAEFDEEWDRSAPARAVALRIVRYRADHGLSQSRLADLIGMRQPAIARLESGAHTPSINTLIRLSDALGIEFLLDIKPAARAAETDWVAAEAQQAPVIEESATEAGGRLLVVAS